MYLHTMCMTQTLCNQLHVIYCSRCKTPKGFKCVTWVVVGTIKIKGNGKLILIILNN
jgi:hypothetical protein